MLNKTLLLLFGFIVIHCTTAPKPIVVNDKLFPDGIYRQRIELEILKEGKPDAGFPFTSVTRIKKGKFEIMGLSPFGTTVFEAQGDITQPDDLQIKFFIKPPAFLKKSFIKKTFSEINSLYSLKESDLTKKTNSDYYKNETLEMHIYKYNSDSIPSVIRLNAKKWRVYVKTQSYKNLKQFYTFLYTLSLHGYYFLSDDYS